MEKWQKLFADAKEKYSAAKTLLEGDDVDMEQVKALRSEADALKERAAELKTVSSSIDGIADPQMPAELPTEPDPVPEPEDSRDSAIKSVYQMRYGNEDSAVKAILKDLHGSDYEQKRWEQYQGFVKYLRTGKGENREFLWTPDTVKLALREGQDVKAMKAVMVESADTLGGYAVPEDWRSEVISRMRGLTVVRPIARTMQTSRDSIEIPTMTGGGEQYRDAVRVTWVDETPTAADAATNLTLGQQKIPIHTVMAETFLSRNLVEDAAFDIVSWLTDSFAQAQAIDEDNKFLKNDGNGSPQGILLGDQTRSSTTIGEVASEDASALTADGLIALVYDLDAQYRQNARLVMNKETAREIRQLKTGDGEYIWERDYQAGQPDRILGYPVLEQENMPAISGSNYPVLFGDFSGYYVVDRVGMSVERFIDSSTARINQVCYVARRRLGGQCAEPWKFAVQDVSA